MFNLLQLVFFTFDWWKAQGMKLHISPEAFFRPNIFLAEKMNETLLDMSNVRPTDVVWDARIV